MTNNAKQEWVVGYEVTLINGDVQPKQLTVTAEDALEAMAEADGLLPDAKADPEVEAVRVMGVAMAEPDAGSEPEPEEAEDDGRIPANLQPEAIKVLRNLPKEGLAVFQKTPLAETADDPDILSLVMPFLVPKLDCGYGDLAVAEWNDLAVLFGHQVSVHGTSGKRFVKKKMLEDAGICMVDLFNAALVNLQAVARVDDIKDKISDLVMALTSESDAGASTDVPDMSEFPGPICVVIEPPAAILLGQTVLRYVSRAMGCPLAIVPASLQEMIAFRACSQRDVSAIAEIHASAKPKVCAQGLFLGDNVYLYHPKVGAAVIADVSDDTSQEGEQTVALEEGE